MPHRDDVGLIQHVTLHLADSLPKSALERIEHSLEDKSEEQRAIQRRQRIQDWLDAGHGSCILREPKVAGMVVDTLEHFDGERYHLHAWVIMPNHVHVLFEPAGDHALASIVATWKKFTSRRIGDYLRKQGRTATLPSRKRSPLWHEEYWDRYIRNEKHYEDTVTYIHNNPVAAGLVTNDEEWKWSSTTPGNATLLSRNQDSGS